MAHALAHVIRIGPPALRIPLVTLVFPFAFLQAVVDTAIRAPARLFTTDFYALPVALFVAAAEGAFVPSPRPRPPRGP